MVERSAHCRCGAVHLRCIGEPVRVSVCHCLDCQRRSGSAFAVQARWPDDAVTMTGAVQDYVVTGESGRQARFQFCGACGGTVAFVIDALPGLTAVPVGLFADRDFPAPQFSVFENRMARWLEIVGEDIVHD